MSPSKTIRLYGLSKKDQVIFSTLLDLISHKTQHHWQVAADGKPDVWVIDLAMEKSAEIAADREARGEPVIRIMQGDGYAADGLTLGKPLRAADMLRCLNRCGDGLHGVMEALVNPREQAQSKRSVTLESIVKMDRWPPNYMRLRSKYTSRICAVMMHHPVTVAKVADMANAPLDEVLEFVDYCVDRGFVHVIPLEQAPADVAAESMAKRNFFEQIRGKFASRG